MVRFVTLVLALSCAFTSPLSAQENVDVSDFNCPEGPEGDACRNAQAQYRLLQVNIAVAKAEVALEMQRFTLAEERRKVAAAEQARQKAIKDAEVEKRGKPLPILRITRALVAVDKDPRLTCNAAPFLAFACADKSQCSFDVGATLCALPAAADVGMTLSIEYVCGDKSGGEKFPLIEDKGYLVCIRPE